MKKYFILIFMVLAAVVGCGQYDDSELKSDINDLKSRMAALEQQCKNMNENLTSLQALVGVIQKQDGIVSVTELPEGKGYSVLFTSGKVIYLYNGIDTGSSTPKISVRQDSDGIYYWTVDGEWLMVDGKKVRASAMDGKDAVTPQLKIEDGYWFVSYDGGNSWSILGKANGDDGKNGDSFFKSVTVENGYAIFVMNDSAQTTIKIPMSKGVGVSSIRYIPKSLDGIEKIMFSKSNGKFIPDDLAVRFEVLPRSAADYIVKNWKNILEAKIVYVGSTRAEVGDFSTTEIKSVEYDKDNILTITIDTKSIDENFFLSKGAVRASLRLSLKLGDNEYSSDYIPIIPFPKSIIIEYSTVGGTKTSAYIYVERRSIRENIPYNSYYFDNYGRIVFDDRDSLCCRFDNRMIKSLKFATPIKVHFLYVGNRSLTDIDISNVDTKDVTNMNSMFSGCQSLTSLDLSSFDTKNVTNMERMFYNCQSLTSLDLSSFDTKSVTNMELMFCNCQSLTSLDLSSFDTKSVTNMELMFCNCQSLTSLDLSSFDTKSVTSMEDMFYGCTNLKEIIMRGCDKETIDKISRVKPEGAVIITD